MAERISMWMGPMDRSTFIYEDCKMYVPVEAWIFQYENKDEKVAKERKKLSERAVLIEIKNGFDQELIAGMKKGE